MSLLVFALALLAPASSALPRPPSPEPDPRAEAALQPSPGAELPGDALLTDETGKERRFRELLGPRPVLLLPVYFTCPSLCGTSLNGLLRGLKPLALSAGRDFDVIVLSFDPNDAPAAAADRKRQALKAYGRAGGEAGWRFLVTQGDGAQRLLEAAGFRTGYDAKTRQYAHPSALYALTPGGKVAAVLDGPEFAPKELLAAVRAAAEGRPAPWTARSPVLCFLWDAASGKYGRLVLNAIRGLGILTLLGLLAFVVLQREPRR